MSSWSTGTNVIKEVDTNKNLTCQMFEVRKQGGGTEYLVRKSDVTLGTKSVTQNGTYTAAADNKYGFSQFSVNVRGGNGSADSHGKPTGGDIKPGGVGSAVVGTDPETGNDVAVGVDESGNLVKTPVPSAMHVITPPATTDYSIGDTLDFTGLVCGLKNRDNTTFTDSRYTNGHIPIQELIFPVTTATQTHIPVRWESPYTGNILADSFEISIGSGIGWTANPAYIITAAGADLGSNNGGPYTKSFDGQAIGFWVQRSANDGLPYVLSTNYEYSDIHVHGSMATIGRQIYSSSGTLWYMHSGYGSQGAGINSGGLPVVNGAYDQFTTQELDALLEIAGVQMLNN